MKKYGIQKKILYCNKHGETEFVLIGKITERWKCTKCAIAYTHTYRLKQKQRAIAYKGGKCELCGYDKYSGSLDFLHIDQASKEFSLSGTGIQKRWDKLQSELDKCQLLCRNCHIELHDKEVKEKIELNKNVGTTYHNKLIHRINAKKLGKNASP